jgi:DNA-binding LytR/AlgR family response regulator
MTDIVYIEALENYVTVVTADKKYTFLFTMKGIENQVPSDVFIRIHRSFIINKKMIRTIYENSVDLNVGHYVKNFPLGKSFKANLMNDIKIVDKRRCFSRVSSLAPELHINIMITVNDCAPV